MKVSWACGPRLEASRATLPVVPQLGQRSPLVIVEADQKRQIRADDGNGLLNGRHRCSAQVGRDSIRSSAPRIPVANHSGPVTERTLASRRDRHRSTPRQTQSSRSSSEIRTTRQTPAHHPSHNRPMQTRKTTCFRRGQKTVTGVGCHSHGKTAATCSRTTICHATQHSTSPSPIQLRQVGNLL